MIYQAIIKDLKDVVKISKKLYEHTSLEDLENEDESLLQNKEAAIFLLQEDKRIVGFAQVQLRHDYVEGTSSSPIGYLEGIYVEKEYRNQHFGSKLVSTCEQWAKQQSCLELASDCQYSNLESYQFHIKLGFNQVSIIRCFQKKL